jgi:hypothetical protein
MRRQRKSRESPATTDTSLAKLGTARKYVKTTRRHRQRQSDAKVKHDSQVPDYGLITGNKDTVNARLWRAKKKNQTHFIHHYRF